MAKKEKVYGTHLKVSTKRAGHKIGGTVGIFVFLLVLALFMALPIYLAVVMSLKPVQELFVFPPKLYVIDPTLSNYSAMFRLCSDLWVPFSRYVFNSIFVTVSVTVCQVIFSAMAAFCLAKVRFPGAKAINAIIVVALLYQSNVIYIMQCMVMAKMGMIDTYWAFVGGNDPVEMMERLKDRLIFIHIKDGDPEGHGTPLGMGQAPCQAVYKKAVEMGVPMVVESETCTPDGPTEARICIEFLKAQEEG